MASLRYMTCCAVREVDHLGVNRSSLGALKDILKEAFTKQIWDNAQSRWDTRPHIACAFLTFTETNRGKYGGRLQELIESEGLGEVTVTGWRKNPNSRNQVRVFTWTLDAPRCKEWWEGHR